MAETDTLERPPEAAPPPERPAPISLAPPPAAPPVAPGGPGPFQTPSLDIPKLGPVDPGHAQQLQVESGGRQFDAQGRPLVPRGADGQLLAKFQDDPGNAPVGVGQVRPTTAQLHLASRGVQLDVERLKTDAAYNQWVSGLIRQDLLQQYGGNRMLADAAYNAGPGAVDGWIRTIGDPRTGATTDQQFAAQIPFQETRNYVHMTGAVSGPYERGEPIKLPFDTAGVIDKMNRDRLGGEHDASDALKRARAAEAKMQESAPEPKHTPVEHQWGSLAMAIAVLGGALTRQPLTTALNAMGGVLNAYREGDEKAAKTEFDRWKVSHDAATKTAELELKAYHDALERMSGAPREALAMIQAASAAYGNTVVQKLMAEGRWEEAINHIRGYSMATNRSQAAAVQAELRQKDFEDQSKLNRDLYEARQSGDPAKVEAASQAITDYWQSKGKIREEAPGVAARKDRAQTEKERHALETEEHARRMADIAADRNLTTAESNERRAAETERHNRFMENKPPPLSAHERQLKVFTDDIRKEPKFKDATESALQSEAEHRLKVSKLPESAVLSKEAADMEAKQFLLTGQMPSMGMGGVTARVQVLNRAAEIAQEQGHTIEDYLTGRATLKADTSSLSQITKISDAVQGFENTALENMKVAESLMSKGAGTSAGPVINRWLQAGKTGLGDADVAAFNTAMGTVAGEYGKIISGGSASIAATPEGARKEASEWLDKIQSPEAIQAQFAVARQDMENRKNSLFRQRGLIQQRIRDPMASSAPPAAAAATHGGLAGPRPGEQVHEDANGNRAVQRDGVWVEVGR